MTAGREVARERAAAGALMRPRRELPHLRRRRRLVRPRARCGSSHLMHAQPYQPGTIEADRRAVIARQRRAVHARREHRALRDRRARRSSSRPAPRCTGATPRRRRRRRARDTRRRRPDAIEHGAERHAFPVGRAHQPVVASGRRCPSIRSGSGRRLGQRFERGGARSTGAWTRPPTRTARTATPSARACG